MSTTIKPLDIYIGDVKVFPDVDLSPLSGGGVLGSSTTIQNLNSNANYVLTNHNSNINSIHSFDLSLLVLPDLNDTDNSDFHTNSDWSENYWNFNHNNDDLTSISTMEIMPELNAKWLRNCATQDEPWAFLSNSLLKTVTFKTGIPMEPLELEWNYMARDYGGKTEGDPAITIYSCFHMFEGCKSLTTINNLDMTQSQFIDNSSTFLDGYWLNETKTGDMIWGPENVGYECMFNGCESLTTLDITWPSTLYGRSFYAMFNGCHSLPENQLPELNLAPLGFENSNEPRLDFTTISIQEMFNQCHNFSSLHISQSSWQYINNCSRAWDGGPQVASIDIPATATKLINVECVLGSDPHYVENNGQRDFSISRYIIRTTAPMTAQLNQVDGTNINLFNYWDRDNDSDFLSTFGGIYVPDAQLQDWKDYIENNGSAPNIAANHVHGLSEL